ncbi:hypothetical protein BOTCAL_0818g00030 [Botryotinia calthae]|uniref:Uncharacterized protein n=1 Tax=Botryotinia calthae TaxID=38488 RepID=A0A4Y8CFU3_9HELO|nr:hypothetical protein BOTCAL_0818g00030 [Botryotinia calthae]
MPAATEDTLLVSCNSLPKKQLLRFEMLEKVTGNHLDTKSEEYYLLYKRENLVEVRENLSSFNRAKAICRDVIGPSINPDAPAENVDSTYRRELFALRLK